MPSKSEHLTPAAAETQQRAALDFDELDNLLGFRVRMAHVAMYRDFNVALATLQVSQRHTAMLWLIGANPGVSQADLGAALGMDSATMVGVIDRLEKDGRVIRKPSRSDRRRRELHLTPAGVKLLQQVKKAVHRQDQHFKALFDRDEFSTFMECLRTLTEGDRQL
jgi:DNA-binding MarR family transcriptional regulator